MRFESNIMEKSLYNEYYNKIALVQRKVQQKGNLIRPDISLYGELKRIKIILQMFWLMRLTAMTKRKHQFSSCRWNIVLEVAKK